MYDYLIVGAGLNVTCLPRSLASKEENVIFGGSLGEYKYYDMESTQGVSIIVNKGVKMEEKDE